MHALSAKHALVHAGDIEPLAMDQPVSSVPDSDGAASAVTLGAPLAFDAVYHAWFHEVCRWLRALGGAEAELDDLAQDVFVVVERKLAKFDGQHLGAWLYRIAARTASDHRRRAWFRNLFMRPRDVVLEEIEHLSAGPAELLEQKENRRVLAQLLSKLSEKRRATFVLYEVEGYSGEEIAVLQGIPVATVWTRLHHARKEFFALVAKLQLKEGT